ncbi:MAG: Plasmid stabilization system protein ParE [Candidatus Kentron sp. G]|nr:MAG: Plasmid stabilization system protein ParE [Candidatus Kentron sp. G]VFN07642.1 MAG: Plasmid stabilization system protein ParE [Candidatus Kentron sp. G]VFN08081.1 MAG: Plasmid stabilization system protein ParE [Candidatus Kentron sp. G]
MFDVEIHPAVYAELEHSRAWYEEHAGTLGIEFLDEVNKAIETVRESPLMWPFRDKGRDIRRYLVHRFPYAVIYRVEGQTIRVIAVMHLRRHPDYWRGRIEYRTGRFYEPGCS